MLKCIQQSYCRTPCGDQPPPPRYAAWLRDSVSNCCRHSVEWVIVFGRFFAMFRYLRASCKCHVNSCPQACGGDGICVQMGTNMEATWVPNSSPEASRSFLASSRPPGAVLEASWGGLGGLLGVLAASCVAKLRRGPCCLTWSQRRSSRRRSAS